MLITKLQYCHKQSFGSCSSKKMFLKIWQISQETTLLECLFNKFAAANLLKSDSNAGVFLWNFQNF